MDAGLPTGTVTLLFSDIEGSTRLLDRLGPSYAQALDEHRAILRSSWSAHGGAELGTEGDSFFVVFDTAAAAVGAAVRAQRALTDHSWPSGERVRVRMGIHTGAPAQHGDGYVGMDVHRAARIAGSAHGSQVVISEPTARLIADAAGITIVDLGEHSLKDLPRPERLFQVAAPDLQRDFPPLRSLGSRSRLPTPATPLLGRDGELRELSALLGLSQTRLVTLTGPGGTGKTRLAIALADSLARAYPDGVFFAGLEEVVSAAGMWLALATALDAPPEGASREGLVGHLTGHRCLIVMDNLEQVEGADAVVGELMAALPDLTVVATSRHPLHLRSEHQHPVPPLALPAYPGLEAAERAGAVQLFVRQARMVRPDFALTEENAADVGAICILLDGLPLGLEIAAARLRMLSPGALLARLDSLLDVSSADRRGSDRQRSLRQAIEWSYRLLVADHQRLLRSLAVFAGPAELDAIETVARGVGCVDLDVFEALEELVEASLVVAVEGADGEPRIDVLNTIRSFAADALADAGEAPAARTAAVRHYQGLLTATEWEFVGDARRAFEARVESEQDNIRAALTWLVGPAAMSLPGEERQTAALEIAAGFGMWFCHPKVQYGEGQRWCDAALNGVGDRTDLAVAGCLMSAGVMLADSGQETAALRRLSAANNMVVDRDRSDPRVVRIRIWALHISGYVRTSLGEYGAAAIDFETALEQANIWPALKVNLLVSLAILKSAQDATDEAAALEEEAVELAAAAGDFRSLAIARGNLACSLRLLGRPADAEHLMRVTLAETLPFADVGELPFHAEDYGAMLIDLGRYDDGALLIGAAAGLRERNAYPRPAVQEEELSPAIATASAALGARWQQLLGEGSLLSVEEAIEAVWARASDGRAPDDQT